MLLALIALLSLTAATNGEENEEQFAITIYPENAPILQVTDETNGTKTEDHGCSFFQLSANNFTDHILGNLEKLGVDALVPIGGDDTLSFGERVHREARSRSCARFDPRHGGGVGRSAGPGRPRVHGGHRGAASRREDDGRDCPTGRPRAP